jgi:hypothetical protein
MASPDGVVVFMEVIQLMYQHPIITIFLIVFFTDGICYIVKSFKK